MDENQNGESIKKAQWHIAVYTAVIAVSGVIAMFFTAVQTFDPVRDSALQLFFQISEDTIKINEELRSLKIDLESANEDRNNLEEKVTSRDETIANLEAQLLDSGIVSPETGALAFVEFNGLSIPKLTIDDVRPEFALKASWTASEIQGECSFPADSNGKDWFEPIFDDSGWTRISLPDNSYTNNAQNRFYRGYFYLDLNEDQLRDKNFQFTIQHDDQYRLFVNGRQVLESNFGLEPFKCKAGGTGRETASLSNTLRPGPNIIAIHLTNYENGSGSLDYAEIDVLIQQQIDEES